MRKLSKQQAAWQHDGCADGEAERPCIDLTGEVYRAQQHIDTLQRFALFGLAASIIVLVLTL